VKAQLKILDSSVKSDSGTGRCIYGSCILDTHSDFQDRYFLLVDRNLSAAGVVASMNSKINHRIEKNIRFHAEQVINVYYSNFGMQFPNA